VCLSVIVGHLFDWQTRLRDMAGPGNPTDYADWLESESEEGGDAPFTGAFLLLPVLQQHCSFASASVGRAKESLGIDPGSAGSRRLLKLRDDASFVKSQHKKAPGNIMWI